MWNGNRKVEMNNGNEIDIIGLGTYEMKPEEVGKSVQAAMECGYRLYDTAQVYRNEKEVAEAIRQTNIPRADIFLTTKVMTSNQGYTQSIDAIKESLQKMNEQYVDLALIHWPGAKGIDPQSPQNKQLRHDSYRGLLQLKAEGLVKSIGVSNFMSSHLRDLFEEFDEKPQVNQVEMSPICYPKDAIKTSQENGVVVQSYSTLGRSLLLSEEWIGKYPILKSLHSKGNLSARILRWAMQKGCCVIPKSTHPERIKANFEALSVELTPEEEEALDNIGVTHRTCWDPNTIL